MNFLERLTAETASTTTENGAKAYSTTGNACLDFFALGAAKRKNPQDAVVLFSRAFYEDKQTAIRILFYIRDIRGGQGERKIFRECLHWLKVNRPSAFVQVVRFIPEYGRWDSLIPFQSNHAVLQLVKSQLEKDMEAEHPSLLAKWMPSENTSSKLTQRAARYWQTALEMKPGQYRKMLSKLRKKIGLLEQQMSSNKWGEINYEKIPGQAFRKHTHAFKKHDEKRFTTFINRAKNAPEKEGKTIIKTGTIYPYEVFDMIKNKRFDEADAVWANLPDYEVGDALVMADVSGSMEGRPMSISVSLALYFAERAKGSFHNKFMTFSFRPQLVSVIGNTLEEKLRSIKTSDWEMNTDLNKAMDTILEAAKGSPIEEVPKALYVISDLEFDVATTGRAGWTSQPVAPYHAAKEKWDAAGIPMPTIIFWNVDSRQNQVPTMNDQGVVLLSGGSPSAFNFAVNGATPKEFMDKVINSKRYEQIKIK